MSSFSLHHCVTTTLLLTHLYLWWRVDDLESTSLKIAQNVFNLSGQQNQRSKRSADGLQFGQRTPPSGQTEDEDVVNVEFVHPKLKEDMPPNDKDPNNPWIWLTSYARIPVEAIQDFCSATKEYCPPGEKGSRGNPGNPGVMGLKGKRGRPGRMGLKGAEGHRGPIGPPGPRGPKGEHGLLGLDGRDGLPGEPGLDGVPGRNGLDGVPGIDGIPGMPGSPGIPGSNGKDGIQGPQGPHGQKGDHGERGMPGPRGKTGRDGKDGDPGSPGISVWKVGNETADVVLIPPKISGLSDSGIEKIIVKEGDHLKLTCASSGIPKPVITWNKLDGNAFPDGAWRKANQQGQVLNLTMINREHMGKYVCLANNGVPNPAKQEFDIEVHFPPLIRIHRNMVGGYNGSFTIIECTVEAFPSAVNYWERHDGKIIQNLDGKYEVKSKEFDRYKSQLTLRVLLSSPNDFGNYFCISKNDKGITKGGVKIFERNPNSALPPPVFGGSIFGEEPPPFAGLEDLCPPRQKCPDCTAIICEGSAKMYGLTILPYDTKFPGLPNRTEECMIETIGKPVFHRYSSDMFGAWMMDGYEYVEDDRMNRVWVTNSQENQTLYEFNNKTSYRINKATKVFALPKPFTGNNHVVYNNSFYYFNLEQESIVQFNLLTRYPKTKRIPRNRVVEINGGDLVTRLYQPQLEDNYFDFSIDENGLWGIFGLAVDNNTVVMKMDAYTLDIQYMWNISLNHHQVSDMFIVCGVLYAVDDVDERMTRIRFALDLYKNKLLDLELPFTNPFSFTTMMGYNPRLQSLATWDSGNQLTYPIKYHAIGYGEVAVEEEVVETGFKVNEAKSEIQNLPDDET